MSGIGAGLGLTLALGVTGCAPELSSVARSSSAAGAGAGAGVSAAGLSGVVHGGQQAVAGATIQLYAVGSGGDGSSATPLLTQVVTTSDGSGNGKSNNAVAGNSYNVLPAGSFVIDGLYRCPSSATQVYLVATGGNPGLGAGGSNPAMALLTALGRCGDLSTQTYVSLNEVTTVASVASLVGFMQGYAAVGSGAGDLPVLEANFARVKQYADTGAGTVPGPTLGSGLTASSAGVLTLSDVIASCVNSAGGRAGDGTVCGKLFTLATPPGGVAPTDTVGAVLNILRYPTQNVAALYNLLAPAAPFQPTLVASPADWNLPILPSPAPQTFNASLNASTIFVGASIVHNWPMPINNAGISGQTSAQVLSRFQAAAVGQGYARVVIVVSTNDVLNSVAGFPDEAVSNIAAMATIAQNAGMEVVLSRLPPLSGAYAGMDAQIQSFNTALAGLAAKQGYLIVDYYTPLAGHPEYFVDGVHPNAAGYGVMEKALAGVVWR